MGALFATLTVEGRLKAQEAEKAKKYPETYKKNSLPDKGIQANSGIYAVSGVYVGEYKNMFMLSGLCFKDSHD